MSDFGVLWSKVGRPETEQPFAGDAVEPAGRLYQAFIREVDALGGRRRRTAICDPCGARHPVPYPLVPNEDSQGKGFVGSQTPSNEKLETSTPSSAL